MGVIYSDRLIGFKELVSGHLKPHFAIVSYADPVPRDGNF